MKLVVIGVGGGAGKGSFSACHWAEAFKGIPGSQQN
jgi:hypothetical protein